MPSFVIHAMFGLILGLIVLSIMNITPLNSIVYGLTIILLVISSLLPDIDHENSFATRITIAMASVFLVYVFYRQVLKFLDIFFNNIVLEAVSVLVLVIIVHHIVSALYMAIKPRHRGFVHSYAAALLVVGSVYFITLDSYVSLLVCLGYVSHLWADGLFFKFT